MEDSHRPEKRAWQAGVKVLNSDQRACRPQLPARFCALLENAGTQELLPFGHPAGFI